MFSVSKNMLSESETDNDDGNTIQQHQSYRLNHHTIIMMMSAYTEPTFPPPPHT